MALLYNRKRVHKMENNYIIVDFRTCCVTIISVIFMKIKRIGRRDINGDFLSHSHNSHEVLYITRGQGKVKAGGSTIDLSAGDIVFIPAGMEHTGPGGKECGVTPGEYYHQII